MVQEEEVGSIVGLWKRGMGRVDRGRVGRGVRVRVDIVEGTVSIGDRPKSLLLEEGTAGLHLETDQRKDMEKFRNR